MTSGITLLTPLRRLASAVSQRRSRARHAWSDVAQAAREELTALLPEVERTFLQTTTHFEQASNQGQALLTNCESLLRLASGVEGGSDSAHRTLQLLQGPLAFIDRCVQQQDRLLGLLVQCEQRTAAMLDVRTRMQATLATLPYVSVLFKIESAALPPDLRESFLTLTGEIERMRDLVDQSITDNARLLNQAHATLRHLRSHLAEEFRRVATTVTDRRQRVDQAVHTLDSDLARNSQRDLRLHRQSHTIRDQIGAIVGKLQFHDIVHQKCEHVLAALDASRDPEGAGARLQALQLEAAARDLAAARTAALGALEQIHCLAGELEHSSSKLDDLQCMTAAFDGMVQMLLETITNVRTATTEVATLTDRTCEALQPMDGLAQGLSSALTELSINMRLIALNAQIRSVLDGAGTGLEQLSARTAQISTEVNDLSMTNAENLVQLGAAVREMSATFNEFRAHGRQHLQEFDSARAGSETSLHAIRDQTLTSFQHISSSVDSLQAELRSAGAAIDSLTPLGAQLESIAARLHAFAEAHPPDQQEAEAVAALAGTYTMDSERSVHAVVTGRTHVANDEATELFAAAEPADPPPPDRTTAAPVATAPSLGANVDLF
ncbi:MAG: hypothetical protein HZA93_07990 [Verrucomicrobia bacterium]|nr:hypothetical protein [Verrucomicrobiota bacterium]